MILFRRAKVSSHEVTGVKHETIDRSKAARLAKISRLAQRRYCGMTPHQRRRVIENLKAQL